MNLPELKLEVQKYQYIEDTNIIDVVLAANIATRLKLGDPVWLIIIGASSGGKSQILRPMALTDAEFIHRVDDLTENTFLSAAQGAGGADLSLLTRIGPKGMIVISDLTVIFSKSPESRQAILSQLRMIYDGEMTKHAGNKAEPMTWKGYLGVLAGSTPSVYRHFQEVADMGERFIHYRMRDYDAKKATKLALGRKIYGKELDDVLSSLYTEYIKEIVKGADVEKTIITEEVKQRIIDVAYLAEKIRTPVMVDFKGIVTHIPIAAMPMRVALQLITMAKALMVMRGKDLDENDLTILDWCAYSLANEEKRACLKVFASVLWSKGISTQTMADEIGLNTDITNNILQNLSAVGVVRRSGSNQQLLWYIGDEKEWDTIRRIEKVTEIIELEERVVSMEEQGEVSRSF